MPTFVIRNLAIDPLLVQLQQDYSNTYEKVWECGGMVNGVFIQSELALRTISEQTITIILQYYTEKRECEVTAICSGGGEGILRIDLGSQSAAETTFLKNLEMLARKFDWELSRKYPGRKGSGCPFCGAYYLYTKEKIQDDGSVICQNCNRSFILKNGSKLEPHEERLV